MTYTYNLIFSAIEEVESFILQRKKESKYPAERIMLESPRARLHDLRCEVYECQKYVEKQEKR